MEQAKLSNMQSLDLSNARTYVQDMSSWADEHPNDAMWQLAAREISPGQSSMTVQSVSNQPDVEKEKNDPLAVKDDISPELSKQTASDQSDGDKDGEHDAEEEGDTRGPGFAIKRDLPSPEQPPNSKHQRSSRSSTPGRMDSDRHQSLSSERLPPPTQ